MSTQIIISILLNIFAITNSKYLQEENNYSKQKLERKNILNKGLWMKDKVERSNYGDFIFRADSENVDNLIQSNFDAFENNYMDNVPVFSSYIERNKRSTIHKQNQQLRKGMKKCKDKNCLSDDLSLFKSKFLSKLKPTSIFNEHPYEVAMLLANSHKRDISDGNRTVAAASKKEINLVKENTITKYDKGNQSDLNPLNKIESTTNTTASNIPKRSMSTDIESETIKKLEFVETLNSTEHVDGNKFHRNVFDEEERVYQTVPVQNLAYNVIPRPESTVKNKPVTEKGLVKVLSLLTKTFKKVMKQHSEIQEIHTNLRNLNEDFMKNVANLDNKIHDFDNKYDHLLKVNEDLKQLNDKLVGKIEHLELKERELSKNLIEFENQQKKFLAQQRQFYTIQKLMLEQNEKINLKQSLIAKTQSEISHRQNNFARVLKKAKQIYGDKKFSKGTKLNYFLARAKNVTKTEMKDSEKNTLTTPFPPATTESIKINLFSIPNITPLVNQDKLILNEKDDNLIDDLVYKYYFNNTIIANLMKSKILAAVMNNEGKDVRRNAKNKRDELITLDTTILLPVTNHKDDAKTNEPLHRERRWIRHHKTGSHKIHGKNEETKKVIKTNVKINEKPKDISDPFLTMATNFCIEIKQNLNTQMLSWCIEKSLRRLKSIDMKTPMKLVTPLPLEPKSERTIKIKDDARNSVLETTVLIPLEASTLATEQLLATTYVPLSRDEIKGPNGNAQDPDKQSALFFPDNDELESNLKQFDLKPDPEGTVYFDGSLHTSDIVISESDALSDIMPGLDSNSHVDVDPLALDLQARRRAYVRRLNADIMRKMKI